MREVKRVSVTEEVVEIIREMIESKSYNIGDKLPTESAFCDMLKVSRTSVREAIRVLQTLGYIENRPGKGAIVEDYESKRKQDNWYEVENAQYYDFMEVRMAIETLSVRLSVERASEKQVQELEKIVQSFEEAYSSGDEAQLVLLDELFHTKIILFTKNQLLININKQLVMAFHPFRQVSFSNESVYRNALTPHKNILMCFKTHNSTLAVEEVRKHLETSKLDMAAIHGEENKGQTMKSEINSL